MAAACARATSCSTAERMFAGYHLKDDVTAIPLAARNGWAGYCHECGPCVVSQGYILPEVFFFY